MDFKQNIFSNNYLKIVLLAVSFIKLHALIILKRASLIFISRQDIIKTAIDCCQWQACVYISKVDHKFCKMIIRRHSFPLNTFFTSVLFFAKIFHNLGAGVKIWEGKLVKLLKRIAFCLQVCGCYSKFA